MPLIIINAYVPGGAKLKNIKTHLENDFNILLDNIKYPVFLVGDLNANTDYGIVNEIILQEKYFMIN